MSEPHPAPQVRFEEFYGELQMREDEVKWLLERIPQLPGRYLEVGTGDGVFAAYAAKIFPGKQIDCIDPFAPAVGTRAGNREMWESNRRLAGTGNLLHLGDTVDDGLRDVSAGTYGVVFIDGAHTYENVSRDSAACWRVLLDGGLLVWHDVTNYPAVARAVLEFARDMDRPILPAAGTMGAIQK